ncbi:MAG: CpsD/CapB family tyrosine-protein kinase [Chloroflexi bacterium]|nr:CpsD/CapB family tyrosine-protein kinase [Chloroflexota bacterium]
MRRKRMGFFPALFSWTGGKRSRMAEEGRDADPRAGLLTHTDPRSPVAEAYRQLRTNIQFASHEKPNRTIMVTSTASDEGKTTTLANLAITIAQTGSKVMVVDCDLRRPSLHEVFGRPNAAGLTTLFIDGAAPQSVAQDTGIPNLRLLASGPLPPNPSELLGGARMLDIIEQLKQEAQIILFDTPPIVAVTDGAVLATRMDAVLLVLRAGHSTRELALRARAQLDKVQANLLGVVLTNANIETGTSSYYAPTR